MRVFIVLAAYNGGAYIGAQIDSIINQSFREWTLLIRDDGSTDQTPSLITAAERNDGRIEAVRDGRGNLGPIGNFGALLEVARQRGADYVFLADQDDIWLPHKLRYQIACLQASEAQYGAKQPLLVHSDLTVVDKSLRVLKPSFMRYQRIPHRDRNPIKTLLAQNFVTGCATVVNRSLLEHALPLPCGIIMHDWWLALCAATYGRIVYVPKATVLYRQHDTNQIGAEGYWARYLRKLRAWSQPHDGTSRWRIGILNEVQQGALLLKRVEAASCPVDANTVRCIRRYAAIKNDGVGALYRIWLLFMSGVRPPTVLSTLDFYRRLIYAI